MSLHIERNSEDALTIPVYRYLYDSRYPLTNLELDLDNLEKLISNLGISIDNKPERTQELQIDENTLESALEEAINYGEREKARLHDVGCLSSIYILRKGETKYHYENCRALFITSNSLLCRVAMKFFLSGHYISEGSVPIAISDYALTTILWLKKPQAAPNLPRKYIIADAYAALNPTDHLWHKYLDEIQLLHDKGDLTTDDYYLLKFSPQARAELLEMTMGNENLFTFGTAVQILDKVHKSLIEEQLAETKKERELRVKTEKELSAYKENDREKAARQDTKIMKLSRRTASVISWIIFVFLALVLAFGAYFSYSNLLILSIILVVLLILYAVFSFINTIFGFSLLYLRKYIEDKITKKLVGIIKSFFMTNGNVN